LGQENGQAAGGAAEERVPRLPGQPVVQGQLNQTPARVAAWAAVTR